MALQLFKIETVEVASPVSSITFSNIPQGYTDFIVKGSLRGANASWGDNIKISFNGSTTSFTSREIYGESGATGSETLTTRNVGVGTGANATANTSGSFELYVPNYTSANYKSFSMDSVAENNTATGYALWLTAGIWSNTSAITSLTLTCNGGSFVANSTFTLYGVL